MTRFPLIYKSVRRTFAHLVLKSEESFLALQQESSCFYFSQLESGQKRKNGVGDAEKQHVGLWLGGR